MITDIEDYFSNGCGRCERFATADCSTRLWLSGLEHLRRICRASGLVETVKWAHPCYMYGERNIAILGAFREDFRISFFNASLMQDPAHVLEKPGPNTRHACLIRFTEIAQVAERETLIAAYLQEAMSYAEAGIKPVVEPDELQLPTELLEALDSDPQLAEAFYRLTPGRQRSYAIAINSAKKPETRQARIARYRDHILAGKGATER